ncbi:MAG: DUF5685 family protein [Caldicoprobacterales bacterium]|nr:hypothetical protein [Clostridiales bacterium]
MFGYIQPDKPELKIREYEIYKAYYCGVCKAIKRKHGNFPRLTLTYDTAFLALFLSSLAEEAPRIQDTRCILHPMKRRKTVIDSEILDYAADMNILLFWLNLKDKWQDDRSKAARIGMLAFHSAYRRLKKQYPEKSRIIHNRLEELSKLEKSKCSSIDQAAEPFAKLMEEIACYPPVCTDRKKETILRWMGYHIGKWLYTIDALDDLEKDIQNRLYNPFIYQYNYRGEDIGEFRSSILDDAEFLLIHTLSELARSFELLDFQRHREIAGNIIYLGMQKKTETILGRGKCVERPVRSVGNQ